MVQKQFNCRLILEEFDDNPFLPFFYEDPERYGFTVELFFMTERYKQLQRNLLNQDLFTDFTIADYSFIKTLLFASKNLQDEEYRMFQKMYSVLSSNFPTPDLMVYFHRSPSQLLKNIGHRGREYEANISDSYLTDIQQSYFEYFRNVTSYPIVIIDLHDVDFVHEPKYYDLLLSLFRKEYRPGVHRISLMVSE